MKYIVTFNIPNCGKVDVKVEKEKMQSLMEAVNQKKVVQINDGFYNTAYFATALPDKSSIRLDNEKKLQIEETRKKYFTDKNSIKTGS
jgi:hypothetical protein